MSRRSALARIPGKRALKQYNVEREGYEAIQQTLYDTQTYAGAGQSELTFFQVPQGQNNKTLEETNMETAGSLPTGKEFLVTNIQLLFLPTALPVVKNEAADLVPDLSNFSNDVYTFGKYGLLDFFIGSKSYLQEAPLAKFPAMNRLDIDSSHGLEFKQAVAADAIRQVDTDYGAWGGRVYTLNPPVRLTSNRNFNLKLRWNTTRALPSGADAKVVAILDGILYRQSQ